MDLGGVILDEAGGLLLDRRGMAVPLRAQSMKVLRLLAARPGEVVSKDDIIAAVWGDIHVTDDSLTQCVTAIRRAIGDDGHQVLQTIPKRGYRLVPVEVAVTEAPGGVEASPAAAPPLLRSPRWRVAAGTGLVLAALGLAAAALWPGQTGAELPSVAVLPFEDLAGEARWERLGRGLAAEIGADLSRSKGFVVIPTETVEAAADNPDSLAEALGTRFVLDGTLQAQGDELRVTARLTDAEGGRVVWSDRWSRPAEDLFAVQDEIVDGIGGALAGTWTSALARAVREGAKGQPTRSLDAYELYLLGSEHEFTPESLDRSVTYLRRALEIDPEFVQAMVMLSYVQGWRADYADNDADAAERWQESVRLAERAAVLAPDNPNALILLCTKRVFEGRLAEAWDLAARAVEIAPTNPDTLAGAPWCYSFADHGRAPLDWAKRAAELNPGHPDWYNIGLAWAAFFAGDLDLARRAIRAAPQDPGAFILLGSVEALAGNIEEARVWFGRFTAETRYRSLTPFFFDDFSADPAFARVVEGARLAGFPVTDAEAGRTAASR